MNDKTKPADKLAGLAQHSDLAAAETTKPVQYPPAPPLEAPQQAPARKLHFDVTHFHLAEHTDPQQVYRVPVEPDGTTLTLDELLEPEFWADAVKSPKTGTMRAGTTIRVIWDDCTRVVTLLVKRVGNNWAEVGVCADWTPVYRPRPPAREKFRVMWGGASDEWRVINNVDNRVWKKGFKNEAEAYQWIDQQERMR